MDDDGDDDTENLNRNQKTAVQRDWLGTLIYSVDVVFSVLMILAYICAWGYAGYYISRTNELGNSGKKLVYK